MTSGLELTLLLLGSAVLGVVAFRMLHLPPMLGYLAVGVLIGPHAWAGRQRPHHPRAGRIRRGVPDVLDRPRILAGPAEGDAPHRVRPGLAQVSLTIVATVAASAGCRAWLPPPLHIGWQAALALGGALAMSSTAIVSKMLTERLELESEHGRRIIGILLFQDLAVVPLLILIPSLAPSRPRSWR
jgi:CPA2 family monovalent cation:H+ antiporter-2